MNWSMQANLRARVYGAYVERTTTATKHSLIIYKYKCTCMWTRPIGRCSFCCNNDHGTTAENVHVFQFVTISCTAMSWTVCVFTGCCPVAVEIRFCSWNIQTLTITVCLSIVFRVRALTVILITAHIAETSPLSLYTLYWSWFGRRDKTKMDPDKMARAMARWWQEVQSATDTPHKIHLR